MTEKDLETCLLQQTVSYRRGEPILVATGAENELFLIHYYSNTLYIMKVAYQNGKLNVIHDYRRKTLILQELLYNFNEQGVNAKLTFRVESVEFFVQPKVNCQVAGCKIVRDQEILYKQFASRLEAYRQTIRITEEMRTKKNGYTELADATRKISDEDKNEIHNLLKNDNLEAIKLIQRTTGLGLADCKKIADNPHLYL